jgi:hypothetical protein
VQLGGLLTRRLDTLTPPPLDEYSWTRVELQKISRTYVQSVFKRWFVSEHTMHPVLEHGSVTESEPQRRFDMKDSMDNRTGEWHLSILDTLEEPANPERTVELQHTGLRYWSAPMFWKNPFVEIPASEHMFKRDDTPKFASSKSWSCELTGEVVWVEDAEETVTGYMRSLNDEEEKESETSQRLLIAPPPLLCLYRHTWVLQGPQNVCCNLGHCRAASPAALPPS